MTSKPFIADPYNEEHIRLFTDFEKKNNIEPGLSLYLNDMRKKYTKEEYERFQKESNKVYKTLFIEENSSIKDYCSISGEKDRKTSILDLVKLKEPIRNRTIISETLNYAFNVLGMEEVFVMSKEEDANLIHNLETKGFESLGEDDGVITYMKEKEEIKEVGKII